MSERRYTDDEIHAIFQRAAARQEKAREAENASHAGLTLAELQQIGAASGIDPAHIAAAVAEVGHAAESGLPGRFLGMPTELHAERLLPHAVSDEAWERIVLDLRRIFGTDGFGGEVGRVREWTVRQRVGKFDRAVKVSLVPGADGTRVVVEQSLKGMAMGLSFASGAYVLVALLMLVLGLTQASPEPLVMMGVFLGFAAAMFGGLHVGTRLYARRQHARFEQALDRIELIARDATASASPDHTPAGRDAREAPAAPAIDLDALPDAPDADRDGAASDRTRA